MSAPISQIVLSEKKEDSVEKTPPSGRMLYVNDCLKGSTEGQRLPSQKQSLQGLPRQKPLPSGPTTQTSSSGYVNIPQFSMKSVGIPQLDEVLAKKEESFSEMLLRMIDEKGLKDSDVYKRADIDRRLFSKIRADVGYMPSKKTAISFCLALGLEMDEAKTLLATAGYTLSTSSRFDLIIMYLIEHGEYNIHFANTVLYDYGEGTLSR